MLYVLAGLFTFVNANWPNSKLKLSGGSTVANQYVVVLEESFGPTELLEHVEQIKEDLRLELNPKGEVQHVFSNLAKFGFPAYSIEISETGLNKLLAHSAVKYVSQENIMKVQDNSVCGADRSEIIGTMSSQNDAVWGLVRTTNHEKYSSSQSYYYQSKYSGAGVDAYIVDTGIFCANVDFTQKQVGTCSIGFALSGTGDGTDRNGHGTHVASTVAGQVFGVAKEANVIAVQVFGADGSGGSSGVITGLNWVAGRIITTGRPSLAVMSMSGGRNSGLNQAINALTQSGAQVFVAAGNMNDDSCMYSPSAAAVEFPGSVISVGSISNQDIRAAHSNWGNCITMFAPGINIKAAAPSTYGTATESGTSMATPHVAGVAAKMLSKLTMSPSQLRTQLLASATEGAISSYGLNGSPNLIVYGLCASNSGSSVSVASNDKGYDKEDVADRADSVQETILVGDKAQVVVSEVRDIAQHIKAKFDPNTHSLKKIWPVLAEA